MTAFRRLTLSVATFVAITASFFFLNAQPVPATKQSDPISVHIELQKNRFAVGEKPILVVMAIKNISQHEVCFSTDHSLYRIHVATKDNEPPKTGFHRHLRGEFRPGDGPVLMPGPVDCRPIASGALDSQKYDLAAYYDLTVPGKYSVHIEIYDPYGPDDGSGHWLRTNTANFEIEPSAR